MNEYNWLTANFIKFALYYIPFSSSFNCISVQFAVLSSSKLILACISQQIIANEVLINSTDAGWMHNRATIDGTNVSQFIRGKLYLKSTWMNRFISCIHCESRWSLHEPCTNIDLHHRNRVFVVHLSLFAGIHFYFASFFVIHEIDKQICYKKWPLWMHICDEMVIERTNKRTYKMWTKYAYKNDNRDIFHRYFFLIIFCRFFLHSMAIRATWKWFNTQSTWK